VRDVIARKALREKGLLTGLLTGVASGGCKWHRVTSGGHGLPQGVAGSLRRSEVGLGLQMVCR
jgi:hypothetical protein